MKINEAIKKLRMALCLEQHEFGTLIGVSAMSVSQYERGARKPRLPTVRKMLDLASEKKVSVVLEDFLN